MIATPRRVFLTIALVAFGLMAAGLVLQHIKHLEPCAMCILQRYAFVAVGLFALIATVHNPGTRGVRSYSAVIFLSAIAGGGVAARQAWMQRFPSPELECGPGLDYMLQSFPMADALPMIFRGGGDCSKVQWTLLGGSIPEWALGSFALFALAALWVFLRGTHQTR